MANNYWYTHSELPASIVITAESETDAERCLGLITDNDESFKLSEVIDEEGNPLDMDEAGNTIEIDEQGNVLKN